MSAKYEQSYKFGPFTFDIRERRLLRDGSPESLTPKASDLLLVLLQERGRTIDKEELIKKVWPDTFVGDGSLTFHVHLVRDALRDGEDGQQYIETVPRRGYRFVAEVQSIEGDEVERLTQIAGADSEGLPATYSSSVETPTRKTPSRGLRATGPLKLWWARYAVGSAVAAAVVLALLAYSHSSAADVPRVMSSARLTTDGHSKEGPLLTDGVRIYFYEVTNEGSDLKSVPVVGGETTSVGGAAVGFQVHDISPSGAWFLGLRPDPVRADRELWEIPVAGGSPTRVGDIFCRDASWSHNGQWISYSNENGVFVANADGTHSRKIAAVDGQPFYVRWSPDGKRIRFLVSDLHSQSRSVWEVFSDGSNLHSLARGLEKSVPDVLGGWTPGGEYFLFSSLRDGHHDTWALPERSGFLQSEPREPSLLAPGPVEFNTLVASKSPNELLALGVSERSETVRYDSKSGQFAPFVNGLSAYWVEFSRDEKWVAYTSYPQENLWKSRPDGTDKQQLTFAPMHVVGLAWSPDGKRIAFRGQKPNGSWKLYVINVDGGAPEELQTGNGEMGVPTWSPDGTRIVFGETTPAFNLPKGSEEIQIYNFKAREVSALTGSKGLWSSRWSPDGRNIAALSTVGQELNLYDCNTKKWRSLEFRDVNEMTWAHDGQSIIAETDGATPTLFRISIKTGKAQRIVGMKELSVKGVMTGFTLAPDDSPIALRDLGTNEVYALRIERR